MNHAAILRLCAAADQPRPWTPCGCVSSRLVQRSPTCLLNYGGVKRLKCSATPFLLEVLMNLTSTTYPHFQLRNQTLKGDEDLRQKSSVEALRLLSNPYIKAKSSVLHTIIGQRCCWAVPTNPRRCCARCCACCCLSSFSRCCCCCCTSRTEGILPDAPREPCELHAGALPLLQAAL